MNTQKHLYTLLLIAFLLFEIVHSISCSGPVIRDSLHAVTQFTYRVINVYPHDKNAFTQGLVYNNGYLYESTGLNGRSSLRKVELQTGKVVKLYELPQEYFGEGLTEYNNSLIQLTWKSQTGLVYNQDTFEIMRQFFYPTEGWGIAQDGKKLIMSDGSERLYFLDPEALQVTGNLEVQDSGVPVKNINELEFVNGKLYANIWQTDNLAVIDPQNGRISGWIDLEGLLQTQSYTGTVDVLNGIAYDAKSGRLFVTGKLWPFLFEIQAEEKR